MDATSANVSEKQTNDYQSVVDVGLELTAWSSKELELSGTIPLFHARMASWTAAVVGHVDVDHDEDKRRRVVNMVTTIKSRTAVSPSPCGKWKSVTLAILKTIGVADSVIETARRGARVNEALINEALSQSDVSSERPLMVVSGGQAPSQEPSGQPVELYQVIEQAKNLFMVHTNIVGGVNEYRTQRDVLANMVRHLADSKMKAVLDAVLEYQRMRYKSNSNLTWKPALLTFLRRAGLPEREVEALRETARVPVERDLSTQEALAELIDSVPQVGAAANSSGGTPKPAGIAEAETQDSGPPNAEGTGEAGTAVNSNGTAHVHEASAPVANATATSGGPRENGGDAEAVDGANGEVHGELPKREFFKRPHYHRSANAYKFSFLTKDGTNKSVSISAKSCSAEVAGKIARMAYMKALETDGDLDAVLKYREQMMEKMAGVQDPKGVVDEPQKEDKAEKNAQEKAEKEEKGKKEKEKKGRGKREKEVKTEVKEELEGPPGKKIKLETLEDAPPGHEAHKKVKHSSSKGYHYFFFGADRFQVTDKSVNNNTEESGRICRLAYLKFNEEKWTKEQVLAFRKEMLERYANSSNSTATTAASPAPAGSPAPPVGKEEQGGKKGSKKRKAPDALGLSKQEEKEVKRLRAGGREFDLVRMHGRDDKKKNSSLNGLYAQTQEGFGGVRAFEKVGSGVPRFLLYSSKRGRWLISDSVSDAQKGFAYAEVKDGGAGGPVGLGSGQSRWLVFDGKQEGYNEDSAVQCTAILSGEAKVEPKREVKEESAEQKVKVEPNAGAGAPGVDSSAAAGPTGEPRSSQSDTSSSGDSESEDDSDDSSSDSGEAPAEGAVDTGIMQLEQEFIPQELEKPAPRQPQPVLHTAKGRVCAKMLVRSLLRCACHFAYLHQCPDRLKAHA